MGKFRWCRHPLRLFFLFVWLACPRKSHSTRHHTIQPHRTSRPPIFRCIPTIGCCGSRISFPSALHSSRVSFKDCIQNILACPVPPDLRQTSASVSNLYRFFSFKLTQNRSPQPRIFLLDRFSLLYIALSIPLIAYCSLVHGIVFGHRYEFIPLMFTSSYSAIGVVGSWVGFLVVYFDF